VDTVNNVVTALPDRFSQWALSGTGNYPIYMPTLTKQ